MDPIPEQSDITLNSDIDILLSTLESIKTQIPDQTYINSIESLGRIRQARVPRQRTRIFAPRCVHTRTLPFTIEKLTLYISTPNQLPATPSSINSLWDTIREAESNDTLKLLAYNVSRI